MMENYAPMDMDKSGRWIRFLCMIKGIAVRDLCKILGISCPQSVYAWFNGRTMPSLDNLYGLSRILESPIDDLVLSTESPIPRGFLVRRSPEEVRMVYYFYLFFSKY